MSESSEEKPNKTCESQMEFVNMLRDFPILLSKSQTPTVRRSKLQALVVMKNQWELNFGSQITTSQMYKKINNMKSRLKKKTDINRTGKKKIVLQDWEKKFLEIMEGDTNPVLTKIPGVLCNIDRLELIMPRYALKGGDVILKCDHSVRLEHLHKVEWKKGEDKLFMYVKGRTPPFKAWAIPGAKLNTKNSSEKQIHLTNLTFAAGGSYYCVVSMETPSIFTKDSDVKDLTIIDPQDDDPKITFKKDTYYIGERLEANCTTSPAKPPPHITWLINDEKVRDSLTKSFSNGLVHGHGYFETRAASIKQLSIEVSQLHGGEDGKLRLTCMATIPGYVNNESDYADIRNATVDIEIMEETPALPSPVEAASSATSMQLSAILIFKFILTVRLLL